MPASIHPITLHRLKFFSEAYKRAHPEEMLAAWDKLKSPNQLDFLSEAHAHNKFQDDVIETVRKDFAPLKQDQEAEHMANLAYLEQK